MADIGLVGLGVMGANLSLNMAEKGYSVAVYNRTTEKTDAFIANAGSLAANLVPCKTLTELAETVRPPRPIVIMVKAGEAVDEQAEILAAHIGSGDILIDSIHLPEVAAGDLLAIPASGAYGIAMASNYNASTRPAVVFVTDGRARLVRRRETYEDLLAVEMDLAEGEV